MSVLESKTYTEVLNTLDRVWKDDMNRAWHKYKEAHKLVFASVEEEQKAVNIFLSGAKFAMEELNGILNDVDLLRMNPAAGTN